MSIHRLSSGYMVFSFRRFLEACDTDWQPADTVRRRAGLSGMARQLTGLEREGLVEVSSLGVRLTDAGIAEAARQGPSYSDLLGR